MQFLQTLPQSGRTAVKGQRVRRRTSPGIDGGGGLCCRRHRTQQKNGRGARHDAQKHEKGFSGLQCHHSSWGSMVSCLPRSTGSQSAKGIKPPKYFDRTGILRSRKTLSTKIPKRFGIPGKRSSKKHSSKALTWSINNGKALHFWKKRLDKEFLPMLHLVH